MKIMRVTRTPWIWGGIGFNAGLALFNAGQAVIPGGSLTNDLIIMAMNGGSAAALYAVSTPKAKAEVRRIEKDREYHLLGDDKHCSHRNVVEIKSRYWGVLGYVCAKCHAGLSPEWGEQHAWSIEKMDSHEVAKDVQARLLKYGLNIAEPSEAFEEAEREYDRQQTERQRQEYQRYETERAERQKVVMRKQREQEAERQAAADERNVERIRQNQLKVYIDKIAAGELHPGALYQDDLLGIQELLKVDGDWMITATPDDYLRRRNALQLHGAHAEKHRPDCDCLVCRTERRVENQRQIEDMKRMVREDQRHYSKTGKRRY